MFPPKVSGATPAGAAPGTVLRYWFLGCEKILFINKLYIHLSFLKIHCQWIFPPVLSHVTSSGNNPFSFLADLDHAVTWPVTLVTGLITSGGAWGRCWGGQVSSWKASTLVRTYVIFRQGDSSKGQWTAPAHPWLQRKLDFLWGQT